MQTKTAIPAGFSRLVVSLLAVLPLAVGIPGRAPADDSPLWGFADLHTHQFANLGFGGGFFHGEAFHSGGPAGQEMERALPPCDFNHFRSFLVTPFGLPVPALPFIGQPIHGPGSSADPLGFILDGRLHNTGGYPTFNGWPHYTTHDHQQMYHQWLERAWRGGLRLMVTHALNNSTFCGISNRRIDFGCGDMAAVDRQIQAAKDLEAWISKLNGGDGWYRIAYSGAQARQIIAAGKLAVVLGIEVDDLFGCLARGGCSTDFVRSELQRYYQLGVRHLFPIHLSDNVFGGSAVTDDRFNINNLILTGRLYSVRDCSPSGFDFQLGDLSNIAAALLGLFNTNPFTLATRGTINYPDYPDFPHCNDRGLTPLGEVLIREMIANGMIIDIDHMSELSASRTLAICEETGYPVVGGHTGFLDFYPTAHKRNEGQKTSAIVERVRKAGGLFGIGFMAGSTAELPSTPRMTHNCGNSSQSFAVAYLQAAAQMAGGAVAVGSDFNGFAGAPGPRFGGPAEGNCTAQVGGVSYPFLVHGGGAVTNDASAAGTAFLPQIAYHVYPAAGGAPVLLGTRSTPSLAPGASSSGTLAATIPAATPSGHYTLWAMVEARPPSVERNAFDNSASRGQIIVLAQPTLGFVEDRFDEAQSSNWIGKWHAGGTSAPPGTH